MTWGNIIAVGALVVSIVALIKSIYTEKGAIKLKLEVMKGELAIELMKIEILSEKIDELAVEIEQNVRKLTMIKNIPDSIANQSKLLSENKDFLVEKGEILRVEAIKLRKFALNKESKVSHKVLQNYINIVKSSHEQLDAIQEKYKYRLGQLNEVISILKV